LISSRSIPSTLPGGAVAARHVSEFQELTQRISAAGLMRRRYGFYWGAFGAAAAALAGVWTGVVLLGDSWLQLILAGALGLIFAQLAFLGHEACHRQVFRSARWNEWSGRVVSGLFAGISYGWWMNKHSRHHANPNQLGKDPDIENRFVAFSGEATDRRRGLGAWLARRQGSFFIPLLMLEGMSLHSSSIGRVVGRRRPNLRRAQAIVRSYCREHNIRQTETSIWRAYATILRYLNRVELKQRDDFACPLVQQHRV
jgi:hypothetical protein